MVEKISIGGQAVIEGVMMRSPQWLATAVGTHVTLLGKTPSPKIIMKAFEEVKPNLIITVPLVIEKIYKNIIQPLINKKGMKWALNIPLLDNQIYNQIRKRLIDALGGRFKEIIIGGAAMDKEVEEFFYKIKFPFTIGYGMTECGPLISYAPWNEFILGSSGKILDIMEARIYKENPEAEIGEIQVRGENTMTGYYKNPEATQEVFTIKPPPVPLQHIGGNISAEQRAHNPLENLVDVLQKKAHHRTDNHHQYRNEVTRPYLCPDGSPWVDILQINIIHHIGRCRIHRRSECRHECRQQSCQ